MDVAPKPTVTTALVWFRRDLRLADNPALTAAAAHADRVVAVYVHAPDEDGGWGPGAASRWWLHHSLARLDADLHRRGLALTIRRGTRTAAVLAELARATGATRVCWNRLYEPALAARDTALERDLRELGLDCDTRHGALLHEPSEIRTVAGGPYQVFSAYWRACEPRLDTLSMPLPAPRRLRGPDPTPGSDTLESLELLPRHRWASGFDATWVPGESGAQARLDDFCRERLSDYSDGRDRPDLAASSRLSPHLHFGEVSARQCLAAVRTATAEGSPVVRRSAAAFLRELGWRDFAHHLLHHFPQTTETALDERFARFAWDRDDALLEAWCRGRTGYPLVDAGMRELWATGWMHNRVRMIVASLLTKNLRQPWLDGARWFWDTLVDADLANNTLGWQWTAGCGADAAPFFRIFNPVLQAERHDPQRTYLRRWLPELTGLPDRWIHCPWLAPRDTLAAAGIELGDQYPHPIVDLATSREAALAAYATIREPVARSRPR